MRKDLIGVKLQGGDINGTATALGWVVGALGGGIAGSVGSALDEIYNRIYH